MFANAPSLLVLVFHCRKRTCQKLEDALQQQLVLVLLAQSCISLPIFRFSHCISLSPIPGSSSLTPSLLSLHFFCRLSVSANIPPMTD
eukprot:765783-Hanusia_phi.AAC.6